MSVQTFDHPTSLSESIDACHRVKTVLCYSAGVTCTEWKAKDGECDKCSEGAGGPFSIERECKLANEKGCGYVKPEVETSEDCVKYCSSGRVNLMLVEEILEGAVGF